MKLNLGTIQSRRRQKRGSFTGIAGGEMEYCEFLTPDIAIFCPEHRE